MRESSSTRPPYRGECAGDVGSEGQRGVGAVGFALLEVVLGDGHGVGDMGKADDVVAACLGQGVESGGFHFDAGCPDLDGGGDGGAGFAVGSVGGPGPGGDDWLGQIVQGGFETGFEVVGQSAPGCGWQVVQARSFVSQGLVDEDEVGRVGQWLELAGGGDGDDQVGAAGEQLLGDQDGEGGSDCAADHSNSCPGQVGDPHVGVVAGPAGVTASHAGVGEVGCDVPIGIEQADAGHGLVGQLPLTAGFTQQVGGLEHRLSGVIPTGRQWQVGGHAAVARVWAVARIVAAVETSVAVVPWPRDSRTAPSATSGVDPIASSVAAGVS